MKHQTRNLFPFAAVLGQEQMKLSLVLNAIHPGIGGVLIRGEKGTAKSTAARALSELLPRMENAVGESISAPFIDLPLSATEDQVIGSMDMEQAIVYGRAVLQPGILARVHCGILYIDEVNLLDDHLVDSILDVASTGINVIEREGLSSSHLSEFVLVGTMNPEEGDLRPQLLDRFGLCVDISGEKDPLVRKALLLSRELFDADTSGFRRRFDDGTALLRRQIGKAKELLAEVRIPSHLIQFIAEICNRNHVAGHRADLVIERAACAHAAWKERLEVSVEDITLVAPMALLHRMRNADAPDMPPPPPQPENREDDQKEAEESPETDDRQPPPPPESGEEESSSGQDAENSADNQEDERELPLPPPPSESIEEVHAVGDSFKVKRFRKDDLKHVRSGSGRRSRTRSMTRQGRYIKSSHRVVNNDLAIDATLRAAAPYQKSRHELQGDAQAIYIIKADQRGKIRERRVGSFMLFVVDASGSMGAQKRMQETKGAVMSLLLDAYQKRDKVAMISFRGRESSLLLPPTNSVDMAAKLLEEMPVGGRTPLPHALAETERLLERVLRKEPAVIPMAFIITDGRANAGLDSGKPPHEEALLMARRLGALFPQVHFIVIDTEPQNLIKLGLSRKIAEALGAEYLQTDDLKAEDLVAISKQQA
ncbi:MAG: VWA domain-containing protein [Opitutales bacterium]|nr:VWA domain-containing protein [Opitutales bacterium]